MGTENVVEAIPDLRELQGREELLLYEFLPLVKCCPIRRHSTSDRNVDSKQLRKFSAGEMHIVRYSVDE